MWLGGLNKKKKWCMELFFSRSLTLAQFLYYLFDRHWSLSEMSWRGIVDDYVGTFSIARHFMLESLVFYLLDDNSEQALEVCPLFLSVIPTLHSGDISVAHIA